MAYWLNDSDVKMLTNKIVKTLHETMAKADNVLIDN
jgi:hypothetical protein